MMGLQTNDLVSGQRIDIALNKLSLKKKVLMG